MDDIHLDPLGRTDWYSGQKKDDSKKRPRHPLHAEPLEEPVDRVVLSSEDENDQTPPDEQSG